MTTRRTCFGETVEMIEESSQHEARHAQTDGARRDLAWRRTEHRTNKSDTEWINTRTAETTFHLDRYPTQPMRERSGRTDCLPSDFVTPSPPWWSARSTRNSLPGTRMGMCPDPVPHGKNA